MLPRDINMLVSVINTYLRDEYPTLHELCLSLDEDEAALTARLEAAGWRYDPEHNALRRAG